MPRWLSTSRLQLDAVGHVIDRIGDCALLGFSQGGGIAFRAADRHRDRIKACVSIEPHGVLTKFADVLREMPSALVLGDFINEDKFWRRLAGAGMTAVEGGARRAV